jgi:hypothetical protein
VDLTRGVAVRLSAFCLDDDSGRLRTYDLWDVAVRGALLVDLALAGRVAQEQHSVVVDATPTGFAPADRLLAAMAVEPARPLDEWMDRGPVDLADVVRDNLRSGRWTARWTLLGRRYRVRDEQARETDIVATHRPRDDWTPATAALAAIGDASGISDMSPGEPAEGLLEPTGPVRWLCEAVVDHLQVAHRRNLLQAGAADGVGSPYF